MGTSQIVLFIINIIGGAAVIGSYVLGLQAQAGGANALWGDIHGNVRLLYGISMILSALGYFAFIYFMLFRLTPAETRIAGTFHYDLFYAIFLLILIPSAFWMPLSNAYVSNASTSLWVCVRAVLVLVGLGAIALFWALLSLQSKVEGLANWLAVIGSGYFAFHTAILDAVIWPALFR